MAKTSNGKLWFTAGIDRSELSKGITAINRDFKGVQTNAAKTGSAIDGMWRNAAAGVGAYLTATAALDMGKQIIDLTRQRELMEKSFEVMLGGADAAAKKIQEINEYAIFSPYTFDGVAKGVQTMSAFGIATEELMPTLRMIGDVAGGSQQRFESLSLAYSQISSAGRLMGQDLLQLINGGFNPLQVISEKTGQSMLTLKKEMEEGRISFEMVADAFKTATSEGGKFYGMTTKMADSIEAAKSTFESAWVEKQIEWGKAAGDNIQTMYEFGTTVVENAEHIAKAFGVLIAAAGTYKAALIAMAAAQKVSAMAESIKMFNQMTIALRRTTQAQIIFNTVLGANPYVKLAAGLATVISAFVLFRKNNKEAAEEVSELNRISQDYTSDLESQTSKIDRLNKVMRDSTAPMEQRLRAMKDLKALIPDYNGELTKEGDIIKDNISAIEGYLVAKEKEIKLKIREGQLEALYAQQMAQEEKLYNLTESAGPTASDNAAQAEFLRRQREAAVNLARTELTKTNDEIAKIKSSIGIEDDGAETTELTQEQKRAIEAAKKEAEEQAKIARELKEEKEKLAREEIETRIALEQEALRRESDARAEYLREFGTYQQKRLELQEAYNAKMQEATSDSERKLLGAQRDEGLARLASEDIIAKMDWVAILGGAGDQFNSIVEKALADSREYLKTDEFKNASIETKQTLVEAIERMEGVLGGDGLDFGSVGVAMESYRQALNSLNDAKEEELESIQNLTEAQKEYNDALKTGESEQINAAKLNLDNAQDNADAASQNVKTLTAQSQGAMQNVQEASQKLQAGMDGVVSGLSSILQGDSLRGIWDGLINIGDSLDGALGEMAESMKDVPVVGWILSILDLVKEGLVPLVDNIGELIAGVFDSLLEETISGDIFESIYKLIEKVLLSAVDLITLGAFDVSGKRAEVIAETAEKNEALAKQEYLAQYEINQLYRERYEWEQKIGETAIQNAKRQMEEARKLMGVTEQEQTELLAKLQQQEYVSGYSRQKTGLFGWGKGETVEDRASLAGMSLEEIELLEAQGKLTDEAEDYLNALRDAVSEGEDLAEIMEDAQNALNEAVVGMGFDEVVNTAMDDLLDGTTTAAEAFEEIMLGASQNMLNEMMSQDVKEWYEGFAAAGADGYTEAEKEYWQKRWEEMQAENEKRKEDVEDITGVDFGQGTQGQAAVGTITGIQEEAPGSIDGKLTALQITSAQTANNTGALVLKSAELNTTVTEMRDGMDTLNLSVKNIERSVKNIEGYTAAIPAMASDIKIVANNTKNL